MKDQLIFDTTDAASIAASDSVGAFLRASDGTLLTHTDVAGKKALDVRVAEGINVEVDLVYTEDSVTSHQGGTWVIDSITNPVAVTATNLDIRDLTHATDSVKLGDGTNLMTSTSLIGKRGLDVNVINALQVNDAALANDNLESNATTLAVAGTAQPILASPMDPRSYLWIYNKANTKVYIGSNAVTAANGFPLSPGSILEMRAGYNVPIFFVGENGKTPEIRTLELD